MPDRDKTLALILYRSILRRKPFEIHLNRMEVQGAKGAKKSTGDSSEMWNVRYWKGCKKELGRPFFTICFLSQINCKIFYFYEGQG